MIDSHGRIIEDTASCPALQPRVQGGNFDETYRFVHVRMLRCHNGTDAGGRSQPSSCRTAEEIDRLVYEGTISLAIEQRDLDAAASDPFDQLLLFKKTFSQGVHATCATPPAAARARPLRPPAAPARCAYRLPCPPAPFLEPPPRP